MAYPIPRIVVSAIASSQGKTTLATGLMAAFRNRGLEVSAHKVGPDYIDPSYHALATGRPGRNLDPWLVGDERIVPLFLHGATAPQPADLAVVEGVMGLYDGMVGRASLASTAHVARLLDAPVVLVADTKGQGRTVAATILGMKAFDPAVKIAGAVLNRVGSARHEALLREALAEVNVPVLGALAHSDAVAAPSRHLGLVPVPERSSQSRAAIAELSRLVSSSIDLDAVLAIARTAPPLPGPPWDPGREVERGAVHGVRVAVAAGRVFSFFYAETEELLKAAGADLIRFDPTEDRGLPEGTRAVVLGGGFPEMHVEALSSNLGLRADLAAFDGPVVAECAGLLYLARTLEGVPMCGRLGIEARMAPRLTLGYRDAVSPANSCVAAAGQTVHGHEFHRTVTSPPHGREAAWIWDGTPHGFVDGMVNASYLHVHWAGYPQIARRLLEAAS